MACLLLLDFKQLFCSRVRKWSWALDLHGYSIYSMGICDIVLHVMGNTQFEER